MKFLPRHEFGSSGMHKWLEVDAETGGVANGA